MKLKQMLVLTDLILLSVFSFSAADSEQTEGTLDDDLDNKLFIIAGKCEAIMEHTKEYQACENPDAGVIVYSDGLPILKSLEYEIIQLSCQTILYASKQASLARLVYEVHGENTSNTTPP